jgi:hypothetical protein
MRGGRRGGARESSEPQVLSPALPQPNSPVPFPSISGSVSVSGFPVSAPNLPYFHSPGVGPASSSASASSPVSAVASSRLSEESANILHHFQRHTLKAPVLRHFILTDFRIWHQQFHQFILRAGPEFTVALAYPPSPALPPPSPAVLAAVETFLLDALQPALMSSININAESVLQ